MPRDASNAVLSNPHELGEDDIRLIEEALYQLAIPAVGIKKVSINDLLERVKLSYSIWLDLDE